MHTRPFSRSGASLHILLLLGTFYTCFFTLSVSYASTLTVPDPYPTIQAAIDAAKAGDTIQVSRRDGEAQSVYYERIVVNKQLIIIGESRDTIIIDGNGTGTVVKIQADGVRFEGFTVRNGGQKYTGIRANSYSYLVIANNTVKTNKYGIDLLSSLDNTVVGNKLFNNSVAGISLSQSVDNNISDNDVSESAYGINLSSSNTTFMVGNTVTNNSYGIYMEYSWNNTVDKNTLLRNKVDGIFPAYSSDIVVKNNNISESAYGIQLYQSKTTTVLGNTATADSYGIYLVHSSLSNTIENNTITNNDWGITLYNSSSNAIRGNTLSSNTYGVYPTENSNNNLIYHNNFIDNTEQAYWNPYVINTWHNGYPSGGNYWSDYTGADSKSGPNQDQPGSDGIGDTPYTIDPNNKDRYPLMNPWGIVHDVAITSIKLSSNTVYEGNIVNINVTTRNEGMEAETFDVTVRYENTTLGIFGTIEMQTIYNLNPDVEATLTFSWNTTNVQACVLYTIKAEASSVPYEIDIADNIYVDGGVKVKIHGDVDGDGDVDIGDISLITRAFGTDPRWPPGTDWYQWNPEADINDDLKVDIWDLDIAVTNYGETC